MKRLFIALPLSRESSGAVWQNWEPLRFSSRLIHWIPPEQFHVTLVFLGDVNESLIDDIVDLMDLTGLHYGPVPFVTGGPGQFPPGGSPKVLYESFEGGEAKIIRIQKHLSRHLASLVPLEKRKYIPHLTMARIRPREYVPPHLVSGLVMPPVEGIFSKITLFDSRLTPQGAVHTVLHETLLSG